MYEILIDVFLENKVGGVSGLKEAISEEKRVSINSARI